MNGGKLPAPKDVDYRPDTVGGIAGEWVSRPNLNETAPMLLYLHGGGYFACSPKTHRPITGAFAQGGLRVLVPDYRLAPEHPFPAALEDALAAWRGLLAWGCAASRIAVAGDSAGGGLALALLLALRDAQAEAPAAAVLFSPWTDLAGTGLSMTTNVKRDAMFHGPGTAAGAAFYLGTTDARTPLASPYYADLHGLPPLLIHAGDREILRDDSTRLAAKAREAGVSVEEKIWPVVPHVWQLAAFVPEARQSLARAITFVTNAAAGREASDRSTPAP
jgi:acetyl esterase/lipase